MAADTDGAGPPAAAPTSEAAPTVRVFAAVLPPRDVVEAIAALARPALPGVRWTSTEQWHVTLAFFGEVAVPGVRALEGALGAAAAAVAGAPDALLGPRTVRVGRGVLAVPVIGLDELAVAVQRAAAEALAPPERTGDEDGRPFRGHLTLARSRGGRPVPGRLVGLRLEAHWRADEVCLVRSELDPRGARYSTIGRASLVS